MEATTTFRTPKRKISRTGQWARAHKWVIEVVDPELQAQCKSYKDGQKIIRPWDWCSTPAPSPSAWLWCRAIKSSPSIASRDSSSSSTELLPQPSEIFIRRDYHSAAPAESVFVTGSMALPSARRSLTYWPKRINNLANPWIFGEIVVSLSFARRQAASRKYKEKQIFLWFFARFALSLHCIK